MQKELSYHYMCVANAYQGIHENEVNAFEHKRDENGQISVDQAIVRFCSEFDGHAQRLINFDDWGEVYPYWLKDDLPLVLARVCAKRRIKDLGDVGCSEQTFKDICVEASIPMLESEDQAFDWTYRVVVQSEGDSEVQAVDGDYSSLVDAMEKARKLRKRDTHTYVSLYRSCPGEPPMVVADFYLEEKGSKEPELENTMTVVTINGG